VATFPERGPATGVSRQSRVVGVSRRYLAKAELFSNTFPAVPV
jgi:hypothetical protein